MLTHTEKSILDYNYSQEDIAFMKEVEHFKDADLCKLFEALGEHCISRHNPLWQKYYIEDIIRKKGDKLGRGSRRPQFCKHCGKSIWFNIKGEPK